MNMVRFNNGNNGRRSGGREDAPGQGRRLSDKILTAFHQACDQGEYDTAGQLLHVLESMVTYRSSSWDTKDRRTATTVVAAYERLWHARHPSPVQQTMRPD